MSTSRVSPRRLEVLLRILSILFALVVIAATVAHVLQLRQSLFAQADGRLGTLSRLLAEQVDRSFATLETAFGLIEQPLVEALDGGDIVAAVGLLQAATGRELLLRELAVVDEAGRIVVSSQPVAIGADVSEHEFFQMPRHGRTAIGLPVHGRGLGDRSGAALGSMPARTGFLTFAWQFGAKEGGRQLVAVIGADSLINDLRYLGGDDLESIALYRYDGALLASSDDAPITRTGPHPLFVDFRPDRETGRFTETLADGKTWLARFATANEHPVVVEVRLSHAVLLADLPERLGVPLGVMASIVVALLLYTRLTGQALRERRQQEDALRAARDAAESAARTKSSFLAGMSHELRTPMTGVLGMIDLLDDGGLRPEQLRSLRVLRNSARSLMVVLDDVLDYSKLEAGRLELECIGFDPTAVAHDVIDLMSTAAATRGNEIRACWTQADAGYVLGDPTRLRQVLVNLVGNAVKFTERGRITVSLARGRPAADGTVALRFEIRDTGIGIPPEVLPTLFEPFRQADSSISRRFGGTGLGLAICRHLAAAMGGRIGAASTPGEGSSFWLELQLPAVVGEPPAPAVPDSGDALQATSPPRPLRILVAEDNPVNRMLIGTRLRRTHRVDAVTDGEQALDAARQNDYDLVLMDIRMPDVDGLQATRTIRSLPGSRGRVPIVALSADVQPETRSQAMQAGASGFLPKPIDWQAIDLLLAGIAADAGRAGRAAQTAVRIDEASFACTRDELGADAHDLALQHYWQHGASGVDACRAALAADDFGALAAAAHSLAGASASVGIASVAAAASSLEASDAAQAGAALRRLEAAFTAAAADWRMPHP